MVSRSARPSTGLRSFVAGHNMIVVLGADVVHELRRDLELTGLVGERENGLEGPEIIAKIHCILVVIIGAGWDEDINEVNEKMKVLPVHYHSLKADQAPVLVLSQRLLPRDAR